MSFFPAKKAFYRDPEEYMNVSSCPLNAKVCFLLISEWGNGYWSGCGIQTSFAGCGVCILLGCGFAKALFEDADLMVFRVIYLIGNKVFWASLIKIFKAICFFLPLMYDKTPVWQYDHWPVIWPHICQCYNVIPTALYFSFWNLNENSNFLFRILLEPEQISQIQLGVTLIKIYFSLVLTYKILSG